ncbi:MAG TPA: hypothetical protein ENF51_00115 [Candidatus Aenigmarchaeota archaeon]|nr:hypothetical protein [Candidatus Aenigmarchaeota archaeon]
MALLESVDFSNLDKVKLVMDWVTFLLKKVGHQRLLDVLEYYVDVGWLSRELKDELFNYSKGFGGIGPKKTDFKLSIDDHITSLKYIMKLSESGMNEEEFEVLARKLAKLGGLEFGS